MRFRVVHGSNAGSVYTIYKRERYKFSRKRLFHSIRSHHQLLILILNTKNDAGMHQRAPLAQLRRSSSICSVSRAGHPTLQLLARRWRRSSPTASMIAHSAGPRRASTIPPIINMQPQLRALLQNPRRSPQRQVIQTRSTRPHAKSK